MNLLVYLSRKLQKQSMSSALGILFIGFCIVAIVLSIVLPHMSRAKNTVTIELPPTDMPPAAMEMTALPSEPTLSELPPITDMPSYPAPDDLPQPTAIPTATPEPTAIPTATPEPTAIPTATPEPTVVPTSTMAPRLYADTSFWNTPISPDAAIDPGSAAMVASALVAYAEGSSFTNSDNWGYPIVYADASSKMYDIGCTQNGCSTPISFRIPAGAKPNLGSDGRLVVIDGDKELDMWQASYDPTTDTWTAGSRAITDAYGWGAYCAPGQRCRGGTAAGFAMFGGVIRPEEIAQGHIDHALSFTTPYTRLDYVACPAVRTDGKYDDPAALPEGARIQLDPAFDVDAQPWPGWLKIIAKAAQQYGAYLNNTGGNLHFNGEATLNRGYDAWGSAGVPGRPRLNDYNFPWDKFRVLELQRCR